MTTSGPAAPATSGPATPATSGPAAAPPPRVRRPRSVFAHNMVCNRDYGGAPIGYEQSIREAQQAGFSGFALNCGSWNGGNYQGDAGSLFQSAQKVAPDGSFKLFFSADMTGLSYAEVVQMVTAYADHPNYLRVPKTLSPLETEFRPVLNTWGGEGGDWDGPTTASVKDRWNALALGPLRAAGIDPFFVPFFFPTNADGTGAGAVAATFAAEASGLFAGFADGVMYGDSISCPGPGQDAGNQAAAAAYQAQGLLTMATVSPAYWGGGQTGAGRPYWEHLGGEGLDARYRSAEIEDPDWLLGFTWNDWGEGSYHAPMDDVSLYWSGMPNTTRAYYKTHRGFARLSRYLADRFVLRADPAVLTDTLLWFRRPHPAGAVCPGDPLGPVTARTTPDGGPVQDTQFFSAILTAPAELRWTNWQGGVKTAEMGAGLSHARMPALTGGGFASLWREGRQVLSLIVPQMDYSPAVYNFHVESGFVEV